MDSATELEKRSVSAELGTPTQATSDDSVSVATKQILHLTPMVRHGIIYGVAIRTGPYG